MYSIKTFIKGSVIAVATMSTVLTVFYIITGLIVMIQLTLNKTISSSLIFNTGTIVGSAVLSIYISIKSMDIFTPKRIRLSA